MKEDLSSIADVKDPSSGFTTNRTTSSKNPMTAEPKARAVMSRNTNFESNEARLTTSPKKRHESLYSRHQRILKRMKYTGEESNFQIAQSLALEKQPFTNQSNMFHNNSNESITQQQPSIMASTRTGCHTSQKKRSRAFECKVKEGAIPIPPGT